MAVYANRRFLFTVVILIGTSVQIIGLVNGRPDTALASTKNVYQEDARLSGAAYDTWVFGDSMPIDSVKGQKPQRARRSIHKEKVPGYLVTSSSPYSSIVYISVGCIGTLVSPIHVLTAAHCIHDGVKIRKGPMMYRLKIGMLRGNGKQHKIRVKKICVSKEIKPTTSSRFAYDYALLELNRPHRKPYLNIKAIKTSVRSLSFHVLERKYKRRSTMYKYSHCPVMYKNGYNYFQVLAKNCPLSGGDSGAAVFQGSGTTSIIGLISATAKYRTPSRGSIFTTVVLRFTDFDVARIKGWIAESKCKKFLY